MRNVVQRACPRLAPYCADARARLHQFLRPAHVDSRYVVNQPCRRAIEDNLGIDVGRRLLLSDKLHVDHRHRANRAGLLDLNPCAGRLMGDIADFARRDHRAALAVGRADTHDPAVGLDLIEQTPIVRAEGMLIVKIELIGDDIDWLDRVRQGPDFPDRRIRGQLKAFNVQDAVDALFGGFRPDRPNARTRS